MFLLLVFAALFGQGSAITCPTGYDDGGNDVCYKVYSNKVTRAIAAKQCRNDGGYLASIPNSFINTLIQSQGYNLNLESLWIGVTCQTVDKTTCKNDDSSTFYTTKTYSNFYPGNPNPNAGTCVYLGTRGTTIGKWFSEDCDYTESAFVCENTGGSAVTGCSVEYTEFGGMCYKAIPASDETTAEATCVADCGHLTSILSQTENSFIHDLAANYSQTALFARIGLVMTTPNKYVWLDGTVWDPAQYSNFGMIKSNLGSCVGMGMTNDAVPQGEWINNKCDGNFASVCKKEKGQQCNATTVGPTLSPVKCTQVLFFDYNGTIYSPGYPQTYESNKCEYIIIVPNGYYAAITFTTLQLDPTSRIELYNDIGDTTPFQTLYGNQGSLQWYQSTENEMKIIFNSPNGGSGNQSWVAEFEPFGNKSAPVTPAPSAGNGCNQGLLSAPGVITSPNYPNDYPSMTDCSYQLGAAVNQRVYLSFSEIMTEQGIDIITVYDGSSKDPSRVLARLSGFHPVTNVYVSTLNTMLVTFTSDAMDNYKGFSATFTAA